MQINCIFPRCYAPLTYCDWLRGRPRNTLMARNALEICNRYIQVAGRYHSTSLLYSLVLLYSQVNLQLCHDLCCNNYTMIH